MFELWHNTEPFMKVMYIVILICIPLLLLSIYKIWRWFQKEENAKQIQQTREKQQESAFYELHHNISKMRIIWYCTGLTAIIFLPVMFSSAFPKAWVAGYFIIAFLALYLVNNWYVALRWRCPVCKERLPCLVGRSSLRPKWVENCPHCGYGNANNSVASS